MLVRGVVWVALGWVLRGVDGHANSCNASEIVVLDEGAPTGCVPISALESFTAPGDIFTRFWSTESTFIDLGVERKALSCREGTSVAERKGADNAWVMRSGILVISMQGGFGLLEASMVRDDNVASIMMKNILDLIFGSVMCFAGVSLVESLRRFVESSRVESRRSESLASPFLRFFLYGYQLAFGATRPGAGLRGFFGSLWPVRFARDPVGFMFHYSFAATASTIDSGAVAERMTHTSYYLLSLSTTTLIYPIVAHWVWDERGWLNRLGFVDFAGSATVHLVGGVSALVSCAFVGPRVGRFPDYVGPKGVLASVLHGKRHAADNYYRGLYGTREQMAARGQPYFALRSATNMLYGSFLLFCSWFAFNTGSARGGTRASASHLSLSRLL